MPGSLRGALGVLAVLALLAGAVSHARAQCKGEDLFATEAENGRLGEELRRRAAAMPNREGRFWKVSRGSAPPSYVLGTLHLSDPRLAPLPQIVAERVRQASVLAVETTEVSSLGLGRMGPKAKSSFRDAIRAPNGRRAGTLLDPDDSEALERLARERGMPVSGRRKWRASAIALLLDSPPCATSAAAKQPYLDALVVQAARDNGVEVVGLETLAEQFGVFDDLSAETERALLISVLRQAAYGASAVESQIKRFLARDAGGIVALMELGPTPSIPESRTPREFVERLLSTRTARMAVRMQPLLERGNAVVAIGIAHLPGDDGLIALLQRAGYAVSAVD